MAQSPFESENTSSLHRGYKKAKQSNVKFYKKNNEQYEKNFPVRLSGLKGGKCMR